MSLLIEGPFLYLRHRHTKDLIGPITLRTVVETLPRDDARRLRRCFWGRQFYRRTVAQGKKAVADGLLEQGKPWKEPLDPILEAVAKLVTPQTPYWEGTPTELVTALGLQNLSNQFTRLLNVKAGLLLEEFGIAYENKARHTGRRITLRYVAQNAPRDDARRCDDELVPPKTSSPPSRIVAEGKEAVDFGLLA